MSQMLYLDHIASHQENFQFDHSVFSFFSTSSLKWVSFKGSKIIDLGTGGRGKQNLQIL